MEGNQTKTREALEAINRIDTRGLKYLLRALVEADIFDGGLINKTIFAVEKARRALSEPARNCELYATYAEAAEAHKEYATAYIMRASNKFDFPMEFDEWLFAPPEKRKETQGGDR